MHHCVRIGITADTGMEVDPKSLFQQTEAVYKPTLLMMMKASTVENFEAVISDETRANKKIPCYALLTPALAQAIQATDMTPVEIHKAVAQHLTKILVANPQPPAEEGQGDEGENNNAGDSDSILKELGKYYEHILLFLWACHHIPASVKYPALAVIQDKGSLAWEKSMHDACCPGTLPKGKVAIDLLAEKSNTDYPIGTMNSITRLSDSMIKYQEVTLKN